MDTPSSNANSQPALTTYDETPYPSASFPETHPDKLCAMARLFGLNAPAPAEARVLELGCANGANLLPMAQHAPRARFLGIDASTKQVEAGRAAIAGAGLTNVEIRHQDILDFPAGEGKFDYIVVHGIFSWVPENVRAKILAICRDHLTENGVAYISYNAFPGWGMRMALRDMMLFHTAGFADPAMKVKQARALTAFLAETVPTENSPYGLLLKQELDRMKTMPDNYVRHDILEEINQPFYFYLFMQRAMTAGLQYLSEPSLDQMLATNFPAKVVEMLEKVTGNIIAKEQYMDFLRNRNFRRTLLCHRGVKLVRNITTASLTSFYYTSHLARPEGESIDLKPGVPYSFKLRSGGNLTVTSDNSFVKAIFATLSEHSLNRTSFQELLTAAREKDAPFVTAPAADRAAAEENALASNLAQLYGRGVIDIYVDRPQFKMTVPERPTITPLARYQALHSHLVTNRAHQPFPFELIGRYVVAACDGQKDLPEIVESLVGLVKEGKLRIAENDKPVEDEVRVREVLAARVKSTLLQLTALGFFAV